MGIDIQRIAKIESVPREHLCPVCQLLIDPNEALQSMCGHLYCKPCLTYVTSTTRACPYDGYLVTEKFAKPLVESNKVLAYTIGKTVVYCSYQNSGCTWVGSLADSLFHCYRCDFGSSLVMCSWCGISIAHRHQREHVQVCLGAYTATDTTQASVAMATSQANAQGRVVASTMMTQEKWYQPIQLQNFAPQDQGNYQQHRAAASTSVDHKRMHQEGSSYHPQTTLQEHHQPITSILGVQPNMDHFSATASQVGLEHAAPSLPTVEEDDMQRIPKKVHWVLFGKEKRLYIYGNKDDEAIMEDTEAMLTSESGVNHAAEVTTVKFDHKLKGKLNDACDESGHRSSIIVERNEIKSGPLGKQVMVENVEDGWEDLGESLLVEKEGIKDDPSLNGTPLLKPTLLDQDGRQQLSNIREHYLMGAEKSRACSLKSSLDRGFDQRSWVRTHENHDTGFKLNHALRSSQPSKNLGEGQFRRGPRIPVIDHLGMPSHGYEPSGGRYGLHRNDFTGLGNLQMGEKGDWSIKHVGSSECHSQTKEHQKESMDMVSMINHNEKKHTMAPSGSSRFGNQNKNEESRFKGSEHEENWSIVHHHEY